MTDTTGTSTSQGRVPRVRDLRDALDLLAGDPAQLIVSDRAVDPDAAVPPVVRSAEEVAADASLAPCQEEVHLAADPDFDIRTLLPAPTNTPVDAGPHFCLGLLHGTDPETGHSDVTIHRICVQGKDELSIFLAPGRHIDAFRVKAEAAGKPLPITINMGLDPAITTGACFEAPTTPFGYDELQIAGGLRGEAVELVPARTVEQLSIARAEIVIEGELLPDVRVVEDQNSGTGHAMPELPGYDGPANPSLPVMRVNAVTTRKDPILHTLVGPGRSTRASLASPPRPPSSTPSTTPCPAWSRRSTRTPPAAGSSSPPSRSARPRTSTTAAPARPPSSRSRRTPSSRTSSSSTTTSTSSTPTTSCGP